MDYQQIANDLKIKRPYSFDDIAKFEVAADLPRGHYNNTDSILKSLELPLKGHRKHIEPMPLKGNEVKIYYKPKLKFKKACEVCGKEFETLSNQSKVCSERCRKQKVYNKRRGQSNMQICRVCGKEFQRWARSVYCGDECRIKGMADYHKNWLKGVV